MRWSLSVVLFVLGHALCKADWCQEEPAKINKDFISVLNCGPVSSYLIIPYLWSPVNVHISCTSPSYSVYTAPTMDELSAKASSGLSAWCGLTSLTDAKTCSLELSPFQHMYVAVRQTASLRNHNECQTRSAVRTSFTMLVALAIGIAIYFCADYLTTNLAFRVSAGTLVFMSGSLVLLAFLLFRTLPHKRAVATSAAVLGSTGSFMLRWLYGRWLPSLAQLASNRWFTAYLVASGVTGATVTYLMDDTANPKVNNVLRIALRLLGLMLVQFGTWSQPSITAVAITALVLAVVLPHVTRTVQNTHHSASAVLTATADWVSSPFRATAAQQPSSHAVEHRSPQLAGGRAGTAAATSPLTSPRGGSRGPGHGGAGSVWGMDPGRRSTTPRHLRSPPPAPWEVMRVPVEFDVKMAEAEAAAAQRQRAATPQHHPSGPSPPAAASFGVTSPSKYADRLRKRASRSPETQPVSGGRTDDGRDGGIHSGGGLAGGTSDGLSPIVRSGMIINTATSKAIRINGPTYNKLLSCGYVPDLQQGMLLPPPPLPAASEQAPFVGGGRGVQSSVAGSISSGRQLRQR